MDKIREEVVIFMEFNEFLSQLENEEWYKMEDALVELCEKVSGLKDKTYEN